MHEARATATMHQRQLPAVRTSLGLLGTATSTVLKIIIIAIVLADVQGIV